MGYNMSNVRRKKSPHGLADLILKHDPNASMEMIANVISEWGDIYEYQRSGDHKPIAIESAATIDQAQAVIQTRGISRNP
jgi:hypothetical protein